MARQLFRRVYVQLVGEAVDRGLMDAFMKTGQDTEEAAAAFVRVSPQFRERYDTAVRTMWRLAHGEEPAEGDVEPLVQRAVAGCGIDELCDAVRAGASAPEACVHVSQEAQAVLPDAGPGDMLQVVEIMGSVRRATELYRASRSLAENERLMAAVHGFPSYFGRDMTVRELVRLYPAIMAAPADGTDALLHDEHEAFARAFTSVSAAARDYTLQDLGQDAFVRDHLAALDAADASDYVAAMVSAIVASPAYEYRMREAVVRAVPDGQACEADDVSEVFATLRARRTAVTAEAAIGQAVAAHFSAMAKTLADINCLYQEHLGRDLEEEEAAAFKARFRRGDADIARITVDLRDSLEYHDVVRGMVVAAAHAIGVELSNARLFRAVQRLLEEVPDKNRQGISNRIQHVLTS
jgi:hypothetical protein